MNKLISRCLELKDISALGIIPKQLITEQESAALLWINNFKVTYGEPPTVARFAEEFDWFVVHPSTESISSLLEKEVRRRQVNAIQDLALSLSVDGLTIDEVRKRIGELSVKLDAEPNETLSWKEFDRSVYSLEKVSTLPFLTPRITAFTGGGIGPGDLFYIIGRWGAGKTMIAQWCTFMWAMQGSRVLVVSNDMSTTDMMRRYDAFLLGESPDKVGSVISGNSAKSAKHLSLTMPGDIIIPRKNVMNVATLDGLIRDHNVDVVFVDGVYLFGKAGGAVSTRDWSYLAGISGQLRALSRDHNIPILCVHQSNRSGDMAYSDALAQDADVVVSIAENKTDGSDDGRKQLLLTTIKNRKGPATGAVVTIDFDHMRVEDEEIIVEEL